MPYWGPKPGQCDFDFNKVSIYVSLLKEWMNKGIATVLEKAHPEQAIIASLVCLRLIGEQFPKAMTVSFSTSDFEFARKSFAEWYEKVKSKLPAKHRQAVWDEAQREFALFEERILKPSPKE